MSEGFCGKTVVTVTVEWEGVDDVGCMDVEDAKKIIHDHLREILLKALGNSSRASSLNRINIKVNP